MAGYDSYILCTSPRSGSTLLCRMLADTGAAGNPASYFHRPSVEAWLRAVDLAPDPTCSERESLATVFAEVIRRGTGETGMFGLRLQRHSFAFFMEKLAVLYPDRVSDTDQLTQAFGQVRFIHLTRQDKVAQAASYVRAQQTGLWHKAPDGTELERLSPHEDPVYDAVALRESFDTMTGYDRDWQAWFEQERIEPFRVTYDALSADPVAVLRGVLTTIGRDPDAARDIKPQVAKLADETSADWARWLREEL
ncbi:Stf0 family sulfotransferase [Aestuariibius sp. 2305UL40-4]|uniref:Stf0 family sulfotransferase n=1 Tax=Aestuariibius violaceus TaxID=3234132 RepID=UPI00345E79C4